MADADPNRGCSYLEILLMQYVQASVLHICSVGMSCFGVLCNYKCNNLLPEITAT